MVISQWLGGVVRYIERCYFVLWNGLNLFRSNLQPNQIYFSQTHGSKKYGKHIPVTSTVS